MFCEFRQVRIELKGIGVLAWKWQKSEMLVKHFPSFTGEKKKTSTKPQNECNSFSQHLIWSKSVGRYWAQRSPVVHSYSANLIILILLILLTRIDAWRLLVTVSGHMLSWWTLPVHPNLSSFWVKACHPKLICHPDFHFMWSSGDGSCEIRMKCNMLSDPWSVLERPFWLSQRFANVI